MMADLEIGPEVASSGGSVSFPQQSPILSETRKSLDETTSKALFLLGSVRNQEIANQNAGALVYYKDKLNHLDEQILGVQDYDAKLKLYQTGQQDIFENLQKDQPNLTDSTLKTIQLEMSNDYRNHLYKTTAERITQGQKNLKALVNNSTRLAAIAKSEPERQRIMANTLSAVDQAGLNGIFHPAEIADMKTKFGYGVHLEMARNLAITKPEAALALNQSDGYRPEDLYAVHQEALRLINYAEHIGHREWSAKTDAAEHELYLDPSKAGELYFSHKISKERYMNAMGRPPSEPALREHYVDQIEHFSGTSDEFNKWWRDNVLNRPWEPEDYRILENAKSKTDSDLKEGFTRNHRITYKSVKERMMQLDTAFGTGYDSPDNKRFNDILLMHLETRLDEAKTAEEQQNIYSGAIKALEDKYKPKTKETKPAGAEAAPPTTSELRLE